MRRLLPSLAAAVALAAAASCSATPVSTGAAPGSTVGTGRPGTTTGRGSTGATGATATTPGTPTSGGTSATDLHRLPLGDGKRSSAPERGDVWSCQTQFPQNGPGAFRNGPWIDTASGTWDATAKVTVDGSVTWPSQLTITTEGDTRVVSGNGLPNHATGTYPVAADDDAYAYDRNPNTISAQTVRWSLPLDPSPAASASCVGMGPIGVTTTGAVLFNALDATGRDAAAHEIQDACGGHPEMQGQYHYHDISSCVDADDASGGHSPLIGYALDGFGIYGHRGEDGRELTDADLDECHGHTHEITWEGRTVTMYHYHATHEYPYTVGCYRGTPAVASRGGASGGRPAGPPPGGGPAAGGPAPGGAPPA